MANPTVPQYIAVPWHVELFAPGVGLPDVLPTGTKVTVQGTLDSIVTAASVSGVPLAFTVSAPSNYDAAFNPRTNARKRFYG